MKKFIGIFLLVVILTGCKTQKVFVPVDHVTTEYRDRYKLDSIYYRDTIEITNAGDTIFKNVIRWRERFIRDTVYQSRTDSIPVIIEVEKEIPVNYLTKWQTIRIWIGNIILIILAALVGWKLIKLYLKLKK
ncbi:MAG TPA: hypothetical protein DEG28_01085 [Porphyromonadaceae bacterium]|mgnify:CR=1 FL=1|nr:hypothetical protein [Porphyromonadaceae bacterium]